MFLTLRHCKLWLNVKMHIKFKFIHSINVLLQSDENNSYLLKFTFTNTCCCGCFYQDAISRYQAINHSIFICIRIQAKPIENIFIKNYFRRTLFIGGVTLPKQAGLSRCNNKRKRAARFRVRNLLECV